jgi:hypothetical protein
VNKKKGDHMPVASQILLSVLGCGIENTLSEKIEEAEAPEESFLPALRGRDGRHL